MSSEVTRESAFAATVRASVRDLAWVAPVIAGLLVVYLPGLGNALVFDDSFLTEGLFAEYGSVWPLRVRELSYGSFVWLHALFGDGWWKQRLVNLAIHAAVALALWALYREILPRVALDDSPSPSGSRSLRSAALGFAVGFFALNPVAVYAVAYLIQRSILLATLFVVLALWLFARGLSRGRPWLFAPTLACYALAVASKEHAVLAPLAALPLYILLARPRARRLLGVSLAGLVLIGLAAALLFQRYGNILGKPFDEYSRVYLDQLGRLDPGAPSHAYALSILNEAWLFFRYGFVWFVPYAGWMSIDLRPAFPLSWATFPQALGIVGYVALLAGGFAAVIRYRDWRALAGLSVLLPALLFGTEFATVWVQDPFVLYRSYLWAIGVPGLVFLVVYGLSPRAILALGMAVGSLLAWQGLDRVVSLDGPIEAWSDAIAKLPDDPRAVGRWFPYLNRGSAYVDRDEFDLALRDFEVSSRLGDLGMGEFNRGAILSARGRHAEALAAFDASERQGYSMYNLPFQRGLALAATGRPAEALAQFEATRAMDPPSPTRELVLLQIGRIALQVGRPGEAVEALEALARIAPGNREARYLLGMAYVMKGAPGSALPVLDRLLMEQPSALGFYARAVANYRLGRKAAALSDIQNAIRLSPRDANLQQWREKILAMP
jgi:tetratricopeptide (TPR) repeat protein